MLRPALAIAVLSGAPPALAVSFDPANVRTITFESNSVSDFNYGFAYGDRFGIDVIHDATLAPFDTRLGKLELAEALFGYTYRIDTRPAQSEIQAEMTPVYLVSGAFSGQFSDPIGQYCSFRSLGYGEAYPFSNCTVPTQHRPPLTFGSTIDPAELALLSGPDPIQMTIINRFRMRPTNLQEYPKAVPEYVFGHSETRTLIRYTYTPFFAAVPEPASWAMMIAGFGIVGSAKRRRAIRKEIRV